MLRNASAGRTYHSRFMPIMLLVVAAGGLSIATSAYAAPASNPNPEQKRALLAMMDEMEKRGEMGGMAGGQPGAQMSGAAGMSGTTSGGSGGMNSMCCMGAMGQAPGAGTTMTMPSALPGFAGASHLYHVGANGFFLDHADKIRLSAWNRRPT
jgi:hypothetical protein